MREARDSIVHLANHALRFIRYMKHRKYHRLVLPDDLARQTSIIRQLEVWDQTLDHMLAADQITARDLDAAKTLRIHQIICLIWLRRSTSPEECANDLSMHDFETAVDLAESINSIAGTRGQRSDLNSSTFLFDMEIVSPIYFVAIKCRHPQLRRRAINVLGSTWRRKGSGIQTWQPQLHAAAWSSRSRTSRRWTGANYPRRRTGCTMCRSSQTRASIRRVIKSFCIRSILVQAASGTSGMRRSR